MVILSWVWWYIPIILIFRRLRQEGHESKANLVAEGEETLSQEKKIKAKTNKHWQFLDISVRFLLLMHR
jgi:hypothetical protein